MNERIRELIKQHGINITIDGLGYGEGNVEGLAELIVRECMAKAKQGKLTNMNGDQIAWVIKEHFGVEE